MSIAPKPRSGTQHDPLYPDSGGREPGESDYHTIALASLRYSLKGLFESRARSDAYVATQLMFYYQQGDPSKCGDPDAMVALGVGNHLRLSFRVWEEGCVPHVVFEICSGFTIADDTGVRRDLYESLRINEYFLFDPHDEYLAPPLQGFRLEDDHYQPITPNGDGSLDSVQLNVRLFRDDLLLRVLDLDTGDLVLTHHERIQAATQRTQYARQRAEDEKNRIERLQAQFGKKD